MTWHKFMLSLLNECCAFLASFYRFFCYKSITMKNMKRYQACALISVVSKYLLFSSKLKRWKLKRWNQTRTNYNHGKLEDYLPVQSVQDKCKKLRSHRADRAKKSVPPNYNQDETDHTEIRSSLLRNWIETLWTKQFTRTLKLISKISKNDVISWRGQARPYCNEIA